MRSPSRNRAIPTAPWVGIERNTSITSSHTLGVARAIHPTGGTSARSLGIARKVTSSAEEVAGYAILILDEHRALLDNIAVDPDEQGSGIGRALIEEVERQTAIHGHRSLDLYTNVVMTANIAWYRKLGFVETRRAEEHGFRRVYMSKAISSIPDR